MDGMVNGFYVPMMLPEKKLAHMNVMKARYILNLRDSVSWLVSELKKVWL